MKDEIRLFLLSLAGYGLLALWMPLLPHFDRLPLADVRTFSPSLLAGLFYALWLIGMFWLVWLVARLVRAGKRPFPLRAILLTTALYTAVLLFTAPYNATDIYRYLIRGRVQTVYDESPFTTPPNQFPDDPFAAYAGEWADAASPYGPVWEVSAGLLTRLSGDNLLAGLLLFKGLGAGVFLLNTALIWLLLAGQKTAVRSAITLLWAWNPALLLIFTADGHNDGLMILWLLLGLLVNRRGWTTAGFLIMLLAPLTKPIGVLALPFFFLAAWKTLPDLSRRLRFALGTAVGGVALTALAFAPFGSPLALGQRLLQEIASVPGFSPAVFLLFLGKLAGLPATMQTLTTIGAALTGTAVLLTLWLLWQTWHGRSPLRGAADIFAAYMLQALSFRLWYAAWPFPWLLLDDGLNGDGRFPYRLRVGFWFLLTSQLSVLIYGHLRVYALGGSQTAAHLIGVPFTFALPFLLAKGRMMRNA